MWGLQLQAGKLRYINDFGLTRRFHLIAGVLPPTGFLLCGHSWHLANFVETPTPGEPQRSRRLRRLESRC